MGVLEILTNPGHQMILESTLDKLVKKVWCE
jgi:hypothetical protein